jgi:ATP-dependent Clp protease protease subunit
MKTSKKYMSVNENLKCNVSVEDRTIYLFDEINECSVLEAIKNIDYLFKKNSNKTIQIVLSSCGGLCYEGLALYDKIRNCPCPIEIVGTGLIASMGTIIYLAGDKRYSTENASFMTHGLFLGGFGGKLEDIQIEVAESKRLEDVLIKIIAEKTNSNVKDIKKQSGKKDYWMSADVALKEGYVHSIIKNKKRKTVSKKKRKKK